MSESAPKQHTPEQIAKLEKSRTISDADLLKGGAEYVVDEEGGKELQPTERQKDYLEKTVATETEHEEHILDLFKKENQKREVEIRKANPNDSEIQIDNKMSMKVHYSLTLDNGEIVEGTGPRITSIEKRTLVGKIVYVRAMEIWRKDDDRDSLVKIPLSRIVDIEA